MDGIADETSFDKWGYTAMAKPYAPNSLTFVSLIPLEIFNPSRSGQEHVFMTSSILIPSLTNWTCLFRSEK